MSNMLIFCINICLRIWIYFMWRSVKMHILVLSCVWSFQWSLWTVVVFFFFFVQPEFQSIKRLTFDQRITRLHIHGTNFLSLLEKQKMGYTHWWNFLTSTFKQETVSLSVVEQILTTTCPLSQLLPAEKYLPLWLSNVPAFGSLYLPPHRREITEASSEALQL